MGQTYSQDFRAAIRKKFLFGDVALDGDDDVWRVLFTSTLTPQDVAAQLSWNDIRLMRRSKPQNLAALLYRCMQQLAAFVDRATAAGAVVAARVGDDGPAPGTHAVDPTAAVTALRIIAQVLPCIFEPELNYIPPVELLRRVGGVAKVDDVVDPDVDPETLAKMTAQRQEAADLRPVRQTMTEDARVLQLPQSPFAVEFWRHFFVENSRCETGLASASAPASKLPPVLRNAAGAGPRCLGGELMALLTTVAFIPGFTLASGVRVEDVRAALVGSASQGNLYVWPALLDGAGISHTASVAAQRVHSAVLGYDVLAHRELVFATIVAALSLRVVIGQSIELKGVRDVFFESFIDRRSNPLLPTLLASCWNYVASFTARGALPYTSHYAAETPELLFATTEQLLSVALTPLPFTAETPHTPVPEWVVVESQFGSEKRQGHFEFLMELFAVGGGHEVFQPGPANAWTVTSALLRACGSPLYAAFKTILPGSQRQMTHGVNEALMLLAQLITSPLRSLISRHIIEAVLRACTRNGSPVVAVDDNQIPVVYTLCHYAVSARDDPACVPRAAMALGVLHALLAARPLAPSAGFANEFLQSLSLPLPLIGGKVPVSGFEWVVEAVAKSKTPATVGDFCLVATIDHLADNSPRWTLPLSGPASTVVKALLPQLESVSEFAQFELFHAIEYIAGPFVSGDKRSSVDQEMVVCNLVSAVVQFMALRPLAAAPFVASIATVKLSIELERLVGAAGTDKQALFAAPAAHEELTRLTALFSQAETVGREALASAAPPAAPYDALAKQIPFVKSGVADHTSLPQVTLVAQQWSVSEAWATVLRARDAPLLDLEFARLFL